MKKIFLLTILAISITNYCYSQTNATNFIEDDCTGVSHNLFDELDNGNIIVISWIMPCGPCATYSLPAYDAVQSFATSNPGKVHFYIADDYANTACNILNNFANSYNMTNSTRFSNSNITMSDYGTDGMPKVVVLAGANHSVYLNKNDDKINLLNVQSAISQAINDGVSSLKEHLNKDFNIIAFPNPAKNQFNLSYQTTSHEKIKIELINLLGQAKILKNTEFQAAGNYNETLDISSFEDGMYFLKISSSSKEQIMTFNILK